MSALKSPKTQDKNSASDSAKLSMRAAREAQNGLSATLANVRSSTDGLTEGEASQRLQREGYNEVAHDMPPTPSCSSCSHCITPLSMCC